MRTQAIRQNRRGRAGRAFGSMFLGAALIFAGTAFAADPAAQGGAPSTMTGIGTNAKATEDARIVEKLHRVNQMEIDAGKMAETKGSSKAVRAYGTELVRDHQSADKNLLAYAKKSGIDPNATSALTASDTADEKADHQKMDTVNGLSGTEFDKQFASTMRDGHAKVITAVTEARGAVSDSKLKTMLGELLPTLRKHEQTAQKLSSGAAHAEK